MGKQTGKFSSQISQAWLAQIIRPFLRHPSEVWLNEAAAECAWTILFNLDNEPEEGPDWADLREMARNAGWTPEGRLSWWTWSRRDDRGSDLAAGWALVQCTARSISLVGPGTGHRGTRSAVDLIAPTPAKVLAAARLLGLVGAS